MQNVHNFKYLLCVGFMCNTKVLNVFYVHRADKKKDDYLTEQHYHARQLVRVPNVCWEPMIEQLPVLEFLLPEDEPSDSFYLMFHKVLLLFNAFLI
jgi:hypothetical protein